MPKVEELVDRSKGKIRADVAHRKLAAMGYRGSERSTRRAVAEVKQAWHAGRRRRYRPWIPEPGMWLQWDWGDGPRIGGRKTQLFAAWLAWSRFRVVIPVWAIAAIPSVVIGLWGLIVFAPWMQNVGWALAARSPRLPTVLSRSATRCRHSHRWF